MGPSLPPADLVAISQVARDLRIARQTIYSCVERGYLRRYVVPGDRRLHVSLADVARLRAAGLLRSRIETTLALVSAAQEAAR